MTKTACIFGSAPIADYEALKPCLPQGALVICADGGLRHALRLGLRPDVVIGDSDSREATVPEGTVFYAYPTDKDFTDTNLCLDYALEQGCTEILLLGGIGGRIDHEFSHFCLMQYALRRGAVLKMIDAANEVWMADKGFTLPAKGKKYVSFFPYGGPVEGFAIKGLKYEAEDMTLDCGKVQASSNEFAGADSAEVSFRSGTLLVMRCRDAAAGQ